MNNFQSRFAWYELITTDLRSATTFYSRVMGWHVLDASLPGRSYSLFAAGSTLVGGVMDLTNEAREMGAASGWVGYVEVKDVEATAKRVKQLGGVMHVPPTEVPHISQYCIFTDPQTARLAALKWLNPTQRQGPMDASGSVCWHELLAANSDAALNFYAGLFGWQKGDADSGEFGTYQVFSAGGQTIGGIVTKPPMISAPFWLYYFQMGDLDTAIHRVKAAGGRIINGPIELPVGIWIVQCADPQGAVFALEGKLAKKTIGYFEDARGRRWSW